MKKLVIAALLLCSFSAAQAGGILTNTNQSARFARLMALDASTNVDAAYYNPAGLVKLNDGFHFSFSNQSAFQTREITSTFSPFKYQANNGGSDTKLFKGTASAPIIPSLQAAYKKGNWVLSGNICVIGGGGKATFADGLPSFEAGASLVNGVIQQVAQGLEANGVPAGTLRPGMYSVDQYMTGNSFIYGAQMGGSYKINDMFSVYGGFRLNIINNGYEGYLKDLKVGYTSTGLLAMTGIPDNNGVLNSPAPIINVALSNPALPADKRQSLELLKSASTGGAYLDVSQSGWGISPIVGVNFSYEKLNIGMKYEFQANSNLENKTSDGKDAGMPAYKNGVNTPYDMPALFTVGASYQIIPKLTANVGFHQFFEKDAKMSNDKQKFINHGTREYIAGLEYKINDMFLVSGGYQYTDYGVTDAFQSDLSFSLSSYAIGFGGAVNVAKNVQLNIGYFWSTYSDWKKETPNYSESKQTMTDVFTRTNKVFAAGVEFSF